MFGMERFFRAHQEDMYPSLIVEDEDSNTESATCSLPYDRKFLAGNLECLISCRICFEIFNQGDKRPRALSCGHSFCSACLTKILAQHLRANCPTCKAKLNSQNIDSYAINFDLESLISTVCSKPTNFQSECSDKLNYCNKDLKLLLSEDFQEWNRKVSQKLKKEIESRMVTNKKLSNSLRDLKEERKCLVDEITKREVELKILEKKIGEHEYAKSEDDDLCENLRKLLTSVEKCGNKKFSFPQSQLDSLLLRARKQETLLNSSKILPNTLEDLDKLCQSVPVFAMARSDDVLYGRVIVKEGRIFISSFQAYEPKGRVIVFSDLLMKFGQSTALPRTTFLQVSAKGRDEDDVLLMIETDTSSRGVNFVLLCSAWKGEKYKENNLEYLYNIFSSSATYYLSSGPPPVMDGIRGCDPRTPLREGLVYGMKEKDSFFGIAIKGSPNCRQHKIGEVVTGFQSLKELNSWTLHIKDCGLVL